MPEEVEINWLEYPENKPDYHRVKFMDKKGETYSGFYSKTEDRFYGRFTVGAIDNVTRFITNRKK